jgi:hypothetical protein
VMQLLQVLMILEVAASGRPCSTLFATSQDAMYPAVYLKTRGFSVHLDDVAANGLSMFCSPLHGMPSTSRHEGSKRRRLSMTRRAISTRPSPRVTWQ